MKIIFFGSSDFSVAPLEFCLESKHNLIAIVTTPDRPKGRGLHMQPNPVKLRGEKAGVTIFTPAKLRDAELENKIVLLKPDLFVVASYGKLIPPSWLKIPPQAAFNIHPSLLPKYRGAAPIPWQIIEGEKETGVTIAEVTEQLDAGDIFCQLRVPLGAKETTRTLTQALSILSVKALGQVLVQAEKGTLVRTPQNETGSSYARKLSKEDGFLDLNEPAEILERKIRAFDPWPGAFVSYQKNPLRIIEADCDSTSRAEARPATLLEINPEGFLRIQAGKGYLRIFKVQLPGRQVVTGRDFANGQRLKVGFLFENLK